MAVISKRKAIINTEEGLLSDLLIEETLKYITQTLKIVDENTGKMELDYGLLKKDVLTEDEKKFLDEFGK